jgi:acyl-CoA reductase-like NAD-dependent aldehyde dehydrogenase
VRRHKILFDPGDPLTSATLVHELAAAVWTKNGAKGIRVANGLDSGLVWVNSHHRNDPSSPVSTL